MIKQDTDIDLNILSLETAMRMAKLAYSNRILYGAVENERKLLPAKSACGAFKTITLDGILVYICTRPEGHEGIHIALGVHEVITSWKKE